MGRRVAVGGRHQGAGPPGPPGKAKPLAQAGEGPEGDEAPPGDRAGGGGGGQCRCVWYLLAGAQALHVQAEACASQMSAVSTGLRMAMMASGQQADADSVAPNAPRVSAALEEVRWQYPQPNCLTSAAMDPSFVEAVAKQSSEGSASRSSAPRGGGGS